VNFYAIDAINDGGSTGFAGGAWFGQCVECPAGLLGDLVAVNVQRQSEAAVPQPLRHLYEVYARRELQHRERMPHVVLVPSSAQP
jgi:hypothetical protein